MTDAAIDLRVIIQYTQEKWGLIGNSMDAIRITQRDIEFLSAQQPLTQNIIFYATNGFVILSWTGVAGAARKALVPRWRRLSDQHDHEMHELRTKIGILRIVCNVSPHGNYRPPGGTLTRNYIQAAVSGVASHNGAAISSAPITSSAPVSQSHVTPQAGPSTSSSARVPSISLIAGTSSLDDGIPALSASKPTSGVRNGAVASTFSDPQWRHNVTTTSAAPQAENAQLEYITPLSRTNTQGSPGIHSLVPVMPPPQPTSEPPPIPPAHLEVPARSTDANVVSSLTRITAQSREEYTQRLFMLMDKSEEQLRLERAKIYVLKSQLERIGVRRRVEEPRTVEGVTAQLDATLHVLEVERRRRVEAEKQLQEMATERQGFQHLVPAMLEVFQEVSSVTDALASGTGP
ncbi:hypothetical protein CONPUDRAFT_140017 [Coniophora puteana RWD-64-598 SS2]|uniref:Uncharacterized protein n=1 Tax=Coniophora puteana (strain RWD-64-598) TaxID=741705 RepID=A0A5M3M9G2_CONPW|nr:uncharacterized protein CONPUDRAFT_140017 [Coniophora puteana RWD-64-598 SS2]EIW75576.1 hypothetical protein CONPUDRAFT_140017 [Coniophora puteana RWD-64-598 SS2]